MKLVLDTNIIISALIKDSLTRKIILEINADLVYPDLGMAEIVKHKDLILNKSGLSEERFNSILDILFSYIELIPQDVIRGKLEEANEIMQKIDETDIVFIATALMFDGSSVWTGPMTRVSNYKTESLLKQPRKY
ncbi:putative nucleotide-binding protein, containing PIN domain [archaeon BMS3Abin16]|nr:putative nucleotide-binding protein, containing PIN domain [archaeon BMS3Abin16]